MATIPLGTKFIGLAANYPTVERRSALINDESEAYTMQDIIDTVGGLPSFIEYNDTNKTVWNNGINNNIESTSFGQEAMISGTSSAGNTAYGYRALRLNATGSNNVAVGNDTLSFNTSGSSNIGVGRGALGNNTSGFQNVAIGVNSLVFNQSGGTNVAIGGSSLNNNTASQNVAVGFNSLFNNTTGYGNIAIGLNSLLANTTGFQNIGIGISTASGNFANSILIGHEATATANNQIVFGSANFNAGAVTTETVSSTRTWAVVINGVGHKILLA
jgi:hypothetical protein